MAVIEKTSQTQTGQALAPARTVRSEPSTRHVHGPETSGPNTLTNPLVAKAPQPATSRQNSTAGDARLRLVYTVLLGAAACLALIGVVIQSDTEAGSPDAPPPAVLEQPAN